MAPTQRKPLVFGRAVTLSVVLFLFSQLARIPPETRFIIVAGLVAYWSWVGVCWSVRRFGRKAIVVIGVILLPCTVFVARAIWLDEPNRRLVAEIEKIPVCHTGKAGDLLAGKVDRVEIDGIATDRDVLRFIELDGLDGLQELFLNGSDITDETAGKLRRFKSLRHLALYHTGVSQKAANELSVDLPNCSIVIK